MLEFTFTSNFNVQTDGPTLYLRTLFYKTEFIVKSVTADCKLLSLASKLLQTKTFPPLGLCFSPDMSTVTEASWICLSGGCFSKKSALCLSTGRLLCVLHEQRKLFLEIPAIYEISY